MTTIQIELPDDLAAKAQALGFLNNSSIQELIESAVRREAGRNLMQMIPLSSERPVGDNGQTMNDDQLMNMVNEEIYAYRAEKRSAAAKNGNAHRQRKSSN